MIHTLYNFFAKRLYIISWLSLMLVVISQLFGEYFWLLELFSHFVAYYALVLLLSAIIYPRSSSQNTGKSKAVRVLFVLVGTGLSVWCLPINTLLQKNNHHKKPFIAYQNVKIDNTHKAQTLKALTRDNPEVIVLIESGGDWSPHLTLLTKKYPVSCGDNQATPFAMHIFSKNNDSTCEVLSLSKELQDFPLIKLTTPSETIYVIHPPPPINGTLARYRQLYLSMTKKLILQEETSNIVVIGDMNSTVFSPIYRDFISDTTLTSTSSAWGPTWMPLHRFYIPIGLEIDHVLTTKKIYSVDMQGFAGSDHRRIIVTKE